MFCLLTSEFEDTFLPTCPSSFHLDDDIVLGTDSHMYRPFEEHFDHRRFGIDLLNEHTYGSISCDIKQSSGDLMHTVVSFNKQADWLTHTSRSHLAEHTMVARRCSTSSSQASTFYACPSVSSIDNACSSYTSDTCVFFGRNEPCPESVSYNHIELSYDDRTSIATDELIMPVAYVIDEASRPNANPHDHQESTATSLPTPAQYTQPLTSPHRVNSSPRMPLSRSSSMLSASSNTSLPLSIASSPWNCLQEAHHPLCTGDCDVDIQSTTPLSPKSPTSSWYSSCSSPTASSSSSVTGSDSNRSSIISTDYSLTSSNDARRYSWLNRPPALVRCTARKRAERPLRSNIDSKDAKFVSESQSSGATDLWLEYWRMYEHA